MIIYEAMLSSDRITKEIVSSVFDSDWSDEIFLLLKDIQENILDKYLDRDRYLAQLLNFEHLTPYNIDMSNVFSEEECEEYDLTSVIIHNAEKLSTQEHITMTEEAISDGLMSEIICVLYECYTPKIRMTKSSECSDA